MTEKVIVVKQKKTLIHLYFLDMNQDECNKCPRDRLGIPIAFPRTSEVSITPRTQTWLELLLLPVGRSAERRFGQRVIGSEE